MENKKQFIWQLSLFLFLIGIIIPVNFCFPVQARAYLAPGIFVTELKINEVKDNEIKGEFTIWNSEKYYLTDLNYEIKLFQGTDFYKLKLIDVNVPKETFFIAPSQKITESFTYQYPENIISGDYTLRAQIINERGNELGWKDEIVPLQGENKFLDILDTFSRVLVGKEEAFPLAGIIVSPEEDVIAFLKVKNPGDKITVIPEIKIFKRKFNMPLVKEYQELPITFAKNETKEINLKMPKLDMPESYLAEVKFYQEDKQVSGIQYFRWVVEGEGGKILYVKIDKDYYRAGENIVITIDLIGPADASDIGEGKLEVVVYDRDGNFIAKTIKDITLDPNLFSSVITIPVEKDLISPRIEAKLIKGENVLDERKIEMPFFSEGARQLEKELIIKEKIKKFLPYLIPAIIILLVTGFLVYRFRIKRKK
jgi:hypothetical protein